MQKQYNFHDYEDEGRYESTFFRGKEPCQYEEYTDCQPEGQHDLAYENDDSTGQAQDKVGPYEWNDGISGISPDPGQNVD